MTQQPCPELEKRHGKFRSVPYLRRARGPPICPFDRKDRLTRRSFVNTTKNDTATLSRIGETSRKVPIRSVSSSCKRTPHMSFRSERSSHPSIICEHDEK